MTLIVMFVIDASVRIYGFGWRSFVSNGWNIYDLVVLFGAFATTIPILAQGMIYVDASVVQLQKVSPPPMTCDA